MTDPVLRDAQRVVRDFRARERQASETRQEEWRTALDGVRDASRALSLAPTPHALLERAPGELGLRSVFPRVLLSTITADALQKFRLWERDPVVPSPTWQGVAVALTYPLEEHELLLRPGVCVVDVARRRGRTPAVLVDRLGWDAYVAAGVWLNGRPRWMLHAELPTSDGEAATLARAALGEYADGLGPALEIALLRRLLQAHRSEQRRAARCLLERLDTADLIILPATPTAETMADGLTARERQVMGLMIEGMTNAAIAQHLLISGGTVKYHVANILSKLGASSRADAVARFMRAGL